MGMVGVWLDLAEGLFVGLWRVGDRDSSPSYLIPLPKGGLEKRIRWQSRLVGQRERRVGKHISPFFPCNPERGLQEDIRGGDCVLLCRR